MVLYLSGNELLFYHSRDALGLGHVIFRFFFRTEWKNLPRGVLRVVCRRRRHHRH